jgi:hypothetical protein
MNVQLFMSIQHLKRMDEWRKSEEFLTFMRNVTSRIRPIEDRLEAAKTSEEALAVLAEWKALRRLLRAMHEEEEAIALRLNNALERESPEIRELFAGY